MPTSADIEPFEHWEDTGDGAPIPRRAIAAAFARAVDAKDAYTSSHCETVSTFCALLAQQLGFSCGRVVRLRIAGMLHDVGKIGTPDRILNKPGPLTAEEFEVIKQHPVKGWEIARAATLEEEADWILHHHERMDGTGYPHGIAGEQIPVESRIILVADAVEAITSDRPYRKGRDTESALEEMEANAGTQFDPEIVDALRAVLGRAELPGRSRASVGPRVPSLVAAPLIAG